MTTQAIISLAKNLNLYITAERIETQQQFDFIKGTQCDAIQGYLLSEPLSATPFAILLADESNLQLRMMSR
ncbi:MAG: EAL domain-containing protein [Gammaproteobacteria bacterium]|nr:EAL domain-containing protein [Gammaproteobacteria bacterium]